MPNRPPANSAPRNVLIDLDEARQLFVLEDADRDAGAECMLDVEDACLDCHPLRGNPNAPRIVTIVANGLDCAGTFHYDPVQQIYVLTSEDLARRYRYVDTNAIGNVVDYLNANQSFTVIPDDSNIIYTERGFYKPGLRTGRSFNPADLGLEDLLEHHADLRGCTTEKGKRNSAIATTWAANSVFRWVDDNRDMLLPNPQLVVCDDGTHESCDFLLAGRRHGRDVVMLVHAKAPQAPSWVSAYAIHDVCSQAGKQMGTLSLFRPLAPTQVNQWSGPWVGSRGEGRVDQRLRHVSGQWAGLSPAKIWGKLRDLLERHSTEREVVLVLGAALERKALFRQAMKDKPTAKAIHALHLIRSTMAGVVGGGARFRILCG
jgi:hypothetical protein